MTGAAQIARAFHCHEIRAHAAYFDTHSRQHAAQLLQIGLACGIVDSGLAVGECGRHDDVGRACHRRFVEQHI